MHYSLYLISFLLTSVNCFIPIQIKKPFIHQVKSDKWLESTVLATSILTLQSNIAHSIETIPISEVYDKLENNEIRRVKISSDNRRLVFENKIGDLFLSNTMPSHDLVQPLIKSNAEVYIEPEQNVLLSLWPQIGILGIMGYLTLRLLGSNNPLSQITQKSDYKPETNINITYSDVLGCDYAKLEVEEIVDFLKNPEKYTKMGVNIPKGILLSGPPGVGKTLLAKATAGESKVPFFCASGSEFVEMFVGMGALRVRKLFEGARKFKSSILFIDEFDALGKKRGVNVVAGGNDEREQTLNQLLVEMDGFSSNDGVVVMASTNRNELLDPALLRPGRFDRQIQLRLPDSKGRKDILELYSNNIKDNNINWMDISLQTPGYSGADLKNLINEAGIFAVRRDSSIIELNDINDAMEKQELGVQIPNIRPTEVDELVSYHEAGHAFVASKLDGFDKVYRISILPTSKGAGGFTKFMTQDKYLDGGMYDKKYLKQQIIATLGGRAAEEIVYGENQVTTGASADFQQATNLARQMIIQFGMDTDIGLISINPNDSLNSEILKSDIDIAIKSIVEKSYEKAKNIIIEGQKDFNRLAKILNRVKKLNVDQVDKLIYSN